MKLRMDITRRVNTLSAKYSFSNWDFDLMGCYNLIFAYCKETRTRPSAHEYDSSNGILYIDGKPVDRVAVSRPLPRSRMTRESADFGSRAWRG